MYGVIRLPNFSVCEQCQESLRTLQDFQQETQKNVGTRLETPWYYGVLSKTSNTTELLKHEEDPAYSHANDNNQQYHNIGLETYQASV